MAGQRTSFAKLERDRAKKAKAAAKRERRREPGEPGAPDDAPERDALTADRGGELSAPELLALIEAVHQRREAGTISEEEFEEKKADLLSRLPVD